MKGGAESLFGGLEEILESFEDAQADGHRVQICDFLPGKDEAGYVRVLQELVRVDLEYRFRRGELASLEDYREKHPELFFSQELLAPLAFEEYRLRLQSSVPLDSSEFTRRYGLETNHWTRAVGSTSVRTGEDLSSGADFDLMPGETLLDFVIVGELGRGAFSRVYLARQSSLAERLVVLKISSLRLKEAEWLARLQHTNIVPVYSVHDYRRYSVLCMPWFGAATLKDVIESTRVSERPATGVTFLSTVTACDSRTRTMINLPATICQAEEPGPSAKEFSDTRPRRSKPDSSDSAASSRHEQLSRSPLAALDLERSTLWIGRQLAEGLSHAHSKGILHRDLKPANVLLTEDGQPMILDFNLAADANEMLRNEVIAGGTLPYMSPEQIASIDSFRHVDATADLYSLGVMLFELLTGALPFQQNSGDRKKMIEERWGQPKNVRDLNPHISRDAASIIQKCLAPNSASRYQNAAEVVDDLTRQLENRPLLYAENCSWKERILKWSRRHPKLVSVTGVLSVSVIAVVAVGLLWWNGQQHLLTSMARQSYDEFQRRLPTLHAEAFAAAIGDRPALPTANVLKTSVQPFMSEALPRIAGRVDPARLTAENRTALKSQIEELQYLIRYVEKIASDGPETEGASASASSNGTLEVAESADQYLVAVQHVFQHRFARAEEILKQLSEQHPDRFSVMLLLGMLQRAQGSTAGAEGLLTAAIALQPSCIQAWYQRGVCRASLKRYPNAISDFSQVLELDPTFDAARVSRAICNQAMGKPEEAIHDLDAAIQNEFPETRIWMLRAAAHKAMKNSDAAARDLEQGLRLTPVDERSWVARGLAQLPAHPERAMDDFRQAQKRNPTSHDAFRNMSMVLSEYLQRPEESIQVLTDGMIHHPQDAYLWGGRGVLYARAGQRDLAVQDAADALKKSREPLLVYMAACIFALTSEYTAKELEHTVSQHTVKDAEQALNLLAASLKADSSLAEMAATDPDLKAIRDRKEFSNLLNAARTLSRPVF